MVSNITSNMKYPLYCVLFILCICRCTHSNAPERGDDRWIQSQVLGYIGRYHEYPSSGEDLIYYKDAIDIYRDEFDFPIELMVPGPSITIQKRAFLNRYNDYDDTTCTICYKNNKYKFSLSLTEWQSNHYDWIAYYYKPALYDKDGYYLFYLTDQIQDDFNKCLFNFSKSFPNHYKYIAPFPVDSPQMVTIPLRVRVRYERVVLYHLLRTVPSLNQRIFQETAQSPMRLTQ